MNSLQRLLVRFEQKTNDVQMSQEPEDYHQNFVLVLHLFYFHSIHFVDVDKEHIEKEEIIEEQSILTVSYEIVRQLIL